MHDIDPNNLFSNTLSYNTYNNESQISNPTNPQNLMQNSVDPPQNSSQNHVDLSQNSSQNSSVNPTSDSISESNLNNWLTEPIDNILDSDFIEDTDNSSLTVTDDVQGN